MDIAKMWREQSTNMRLVGCICSECGVHLFPKRLRCSECNGTELNAYLFNGQGEIVSHTVVYEPPKGFEDQVPYVAGLVRLDEGPVISAMITDVDPKEVRAGLRVEMVTRRIRCQGADAPIVYGYKFAQRVHMTEPSSENRKRDHLSLCATDRVAFKNKTTLFDQVEFIHRALPEVDLAEVDTSLEFFGKRLSAPVWMSAITGGTPEAIPFNHAMAELAESQGIAFCLGSLKPMLYDKSRTKDFQVRDRAPSTLVIANVGGTELLQSKPKDILSAVKTIGADGLTVHLNPLMELVQPGGDVSFRGVIDGIAALRDASADVPIIVKETGCGMSFEDADLLLKIGITNVEIGGAGGTSWVGVETLRAQGAQRRLGELLWDWGIPTAVSTAWFADRGFQVVAGGGIRTARDVASALALGARLTGVAAPLVQHYEEGGIDAVRLYLEEIVSGLKTIMLITGITTLEQFKQLPRVIGPELQRWLDTASVTK